MAQLFLFSFCGIALQFFPPNFLGKMRAANFFRDCVWVEETSSQVSERRRRRRGYCVLARKCQSRRKKKKKMEISPPSPYTACGKGIKETKIKKRRKKVFFPTSSLDENACGTRKQKGRRKKENSFLKIGTPALEIGDGTIKRG